MQYFKSKESELFYYQTQAECYQVLIDSFSKIIDTVKNFDNKVYNVRFERALKEIFAGSEIRIYMDKLKINICYHKPYSDPANKNSCFYLDHDYYWSELVLNQENRIQANETIKDIESTINQLTENKNQLIETINNFAVLQQEYTDICNKIREFNNKYSYTVRENYKFDRVY